MNREARIYLEGLAFINSGLEGILIGHKRGHEYFIEQVFPYHNTLSITEGVFIKLNQHFEDRIVGFYAFLPDNKRAKNILVPYTAGKVFLRVDMDKERGISLDYFFIDYDETFCLKPIEKFRFKKD